MNEHLRRQWRRAVAGTTRQLEFPTRESTRNITENFSFADGDSWPEVRDNYIAHAPKMRAMREDIRRNGINKPIPVDYEQDPPKVLDGHTRLYHADALGMEHVPVRHVTEDDHRWEEASPEDGHYVAPREHIDHDARHRGWAQDAAQEHGHDLGEFARHPSVASVQTASCRRCGAGAHYTSMGRIGGDATQAPCEGNPR